MFNLTSQQTDIDKIYLYVKDIYETKYQFSINKCENAGLKYFNDSNTFIEHSNNLDDIYINIGGLNPGKGHKILILFDDMIAAILTNKKLNPIVTELFIRGRKLSNSLVFIKQPFFAVSKNIRLNSTHYFVIKNPNKQEFQQTAFNN